jgi:hypothetical protein
MIVTNEAAVVVSDGRAFSQIGYLTCDGCVVAALYADQDECIKAGANRNERCSQLQQTKKGDQPSSAHFGEQPMAQPLIMRVGHDD